MLGCIFEQNRPALPVGDEMQVGRRVGDTKLFGYHVTLKLAALVAAVFLRPGHADPTLGADAFAEGAIVGLAVAAAMRIEGTRRNLFGQERAHFFTKRGAFRRQPYRIKPQCRTHRDATHGQNSSAPRQAARLPSSFAQWLSLPKSSRQDSMRNVKRCNTCSWVKPI